MSKIRKTVRMEKELVTKIENEGAKNGLNYSNMVRLVMSKYVNNTKEVKIMK